MILEINRIWDIVNGKYGNNIFVRFDENNVEHYENIFLNTLKFLITGILFSKSNRKMGNLTIRISS